MARISTRDEFKCYVLRKIGAPLLDLVLETTPLNECDTTGTTATTGTTGTSGTSEETSTQTTSTTGTPQCQAFSESVCTQLDLAIDDALDYFQQFGSDLGNEKAIMYIVMQNKQMYYDVPRCVIAMEQPLRKGSTYVFDAEEAAEAVGLFSLQSQFGPRGVFSYLGAGSHDTLLTYETAWQYNALVDLRYTIKFEANFLQLQKKVMITPTPSEKDHGHILPMFCSITVPDEHCYNNLWVQRYATALTMEQIGRNLSMYEGMSLPGGGAFNNSFYWDMGVQEKEKLEEQLRTGDYGNPVAGGFFTVG
jgi:hypothetical protein